MSEELKKVLVVIPTYNEAENIGMVIPRVLDACPNSDILVVDDNSPDGTQKLVESISSENSRVKMISRKNKSGLGTAYVAGFRYAIENGYDYVVEMDADLSHEPTEIPKFCRALLDHADEGIG